MKAFSDKQKILFFAQIFKGKFIGWRDTPYFSTRSD
jgi:hypothetical protein